MDCTVDNDQQHKDSTDATDEDSTDILLRDSCSTRTAAPKVSLRLPFRSENFKAQSLLARFHSSRKSESGIKSELKWSNNGASFGKGWRRQKSSNLEVQQLQSGTSSASLPDDLNQNDLLRVNYNSGTGGGSNNAVRGVHDELETSISRCFSEDSPFLPASSSKFTEDLFGTWPGRPKKFKSLKKRFLASGSKNNGVNERCVHTEYDKSKLPSQVVVPVDDNDHLSPESGKNCKDGFMDRKEEERCGISQQHVSLDALLETLPLVYNPATRQLCLGTRSRTGSSFKRMTDKTPDRKYGLEDKQILTDKHTTSDDNGEQESQQELLWKNIDFNETGSTAKHLEIIKEVDENGETVRLVDKGTPQSGNVSGSSSLDRGNYENLRNSLHRVGTSNSLSITDASSFSSLSSSNTELSAYSATDSAVCLGSHLSDTGSLRDFVISDSDNKNKKKGIADFFTRNLFSWRHKDGGGSNSDGASTSSTSSSPVPPSPTVPSSSSSPSPGWRLFSRPSSRSTRSPDVLARNSEVEAGSAGLIMETRPTSLPAKTPQEQLRHHHQYQQMVSAARKKELREAKERKKAQASQQRQEEQLTAAVTTWNSDILPKWQTMHMQKKCRELWWQGLPSCVRGKVWRLAIGNELSITPELYTIMLLRSQEQLGQLRECGSVTCQEDQAGDGGDHESTLGLISLDVSRTFPHLCIFQQGGPYHDPLHNILGAYACYRPDMGYVQGMSFLAATLLLNMDEVDAFITFCNLLNRPAHTAFFRVNQPMMCAYYQTFEELLAHNLPQLAAHLRLIGVTPDLYVLDWLLTVFARPLPLDAAVRIWDVYLRDGEEFLLRAAIGILKLYESVLSNQECTATAAQFLTRLPDDLCPDALFRTIASVRTCLNKRTFAHILQANMEAATTAPQAPS